MPDAPTRPNPTDVIEQALSLSAGEVYRHREQADAIVNALMDAGLTIEPVPDSAAIDRLSAVTCLIGHQRSLAQSLSAMADQLCAIAVVQVQQAVAFERYEQTAPGRETPGNRPSVAVGGLTGQGAGDPPSPPHDGSHAALIEQLAEAAHDAWLGTTRAQGAYTRTSPWGEDLMVPYGALSEQAKDLDRATARSVLAAAERAGITVTPRPAGRDDAEHAAADALRAAWPDLADDPVHADQLAAVALRAAGPIITAQARRPLEKALRVQRQNMEAIDEDARADERRKVAEEIAAEIERVDAVFAPTGDDLSSLTREWCANLARSRAVTPDGPTTENGDDRG